MLHCFHDRRIISSLVNLEYSDKSCIYVDQPVVVTLALRMNPPICWVEKHQCFYNIYIHLKGLEEEHITTYNERFKMKTHGFR